MKNKLQILCAMILSTMSMATVKAQGVNTMPFQASMDTFQAVNGTIVDFPNADDVAFQNLPIGFTFNYGGSSFTTFTATTNGWISFNATSNAAFTQVLSGSNNNVVAAFGGDLQNEGSASSNLSYATFGTAPNRVCCVQWLHYKYFANQTGDLNFQIWLNENSDCIRIVYGTLTLGLNNSGFQMGLRGSSNSDYSVLGDTSCNWALAQPSSAITTMFPVSTMCSMPGGFAYHWGGCNNTTGVTFSYLTGKVFNDMNGNGVFDGGDVNLANHILQVNPGNYYVSTNSNGNYSFFFMDSTTTYTITPAATPYWNLTTPSSISVTPQTQACSGLNFGMQIVPGIFDASINCVNWTMQPGGGGFLPISYHNSGTTILNDTITLVMDPLLSFVNCNTTPTSVNGQVVKWAYNNLLPGQGGSLWVQLGCSSSAVIGNYVNSTLSIGPWAGDVDTTNNSIILHQLLSAAFDPNEKSVYPAGEIPAGTDLHYTIHFQNTGNASATTVIIRDTLDAGVDPLSLLVDGSSHPVIFSMSGNGIATFTFYGIMLPDSGSNFAGSQGFVSYTVRTLTNLTNGTMVKNRAGIYFDINPVVMTNTTTNVIATATSSPLVSNSGNTYFIHPNPANDQINFIFNSNNQSNVDLKIISVDGRVLMTKQNITSNQSVDISNLSTGIYFCILSNSNGSQVLKLVKE